MSENLTPEILPMQEKMNHELVKANVTDAVIATLRDRYMPLKIAGLDDKETYLQVKEGRKECKALRVMAKKICTNGREEATAVQKAWIAKEKEVTGRIAEIEDYLEEQEKAYEAEVAKEKEARKRKQEEQFIMRQQALTNMGALYADGSFVLGEVSFDFAAIKESEEDIWLEAILPKYQEEHEKIEAERLEQDRIKKEKEAELKRQQEELERKQKELADKESELKREAERQALEADKRRAVMIETRTQQVVSLGFKYNGSVEYHFHEFTILYQDIHDYSVVEWEGLMVRASAYVTDKKKEEAAQKRIEQERNDLHKKRFAELLPYKDYQPSVSMEELWSFSEEDYQKILYDKKNAFDLAEEDKRKRIAEDAAKKERERIEEEQRQAEAKRIKDQREFRLAALSQYNVVYNGERGELGALSDELWWSYINDVKATYEEILRKQEEERKAEELAQAGDKEKWNAILSSISSVEATIASFSMRSGQYRKKAAILREKLEEIKAL